MTAVKKTFFLAAFIFSTSLVLTYSWYYNPALFPSVPQPFSISITNTLSAYTAEDIATAGILFGFVISLIIVTCMTMTVVYLWTHFKCTNKSGHSDYERLKHLTEKEIEDNAKSDEDAPLLTEQDLKKFKRVNPKKD
jgi:hypothetical protein